MTKVEFIDQTVRDGQQSLWGMRMRAGAVTQVADKINRAGFHTVEVPSGSSFTVQIRYLREDPWESLDWFRQCLPDVRLRAGKRPTSSGQYGISPTSILELTTRLMIKHGIDSVWIYDCLYNMDAMERACRTTAEAGASEILPAIMFGISPVHTDEFYANKVREMAAWGVATAIYFEDAPGILTPERAATLVPAMTDAAQGLPLEMHCHNTTGLAPLNYIEALKHGVRIIHTASRPLANGPSLPSTEMMVENLGALGYDHDLDVDVLAPIASHFERVGRQEGHPLGVPNEYSAHVYEHQLPGGMTGSFKAQLAQYGMQDRLPEVLHEISRVRGELGHPVSATPFSQLIGIQAVLNVVNPGERYQVTTDEIVLYVLGHYGEPPAPIDEEVKDRLLSTPRGRELLNWRRPDDTIEELRRAYGGPHLSDEELVRRYYAPLEDVEATRAAGPLKRTYEFEDDMSLPTVVRHILEMSRAGRVLFQAPGISLDVARSN
jgi:oxaloacetate decarboxylase (Na+ extruding) subunit alpha